MQKDETAVNTDCQIPIPQPMSGTNAKLKRNAPVASQATVPIRMYLTRDFIPSKLTEPADCITSLRLESEALFCTYRKKTESMVISPSPPICMSTSIIA